LEIISNKISVELVLHIRLVYLNW